MEGETIDATEPGTQQYPRKRCFLIGPIGEEGSEVRREADLLRHLIVRPVLQSHPFHYQVKRGEEDADPGLIGDSMIRDILDSELVVADLTGSNPNAFYELGIRHAAGKPTIHVAQLGTKLPFDTIQQRTIFFDVTRAESIEAAREQLASFAAEIERPNHRVTNPVLRAQAGFTLSQSAIPQDQLIAEMLGRIDRLESAAAATASIATRLEESAAQTHTGRQSLIKAMVAVLRAQDLRGDDLSTMSGVKQMLDARGLGCHDMAISVDDIWFRLVDGATYIVPRAPTDH